MKLYFSIYNKVLKCLRTIHSHYVTHYDLKCDNVLISFNQNNEYYHLALDQYNGLAAFTLTEEYLEFPDGSIQTTAFKRNSNNITS